MTIKDPKAFGEQFAALARERAQNALQVAVAGDDGAFGAFLFGAFLKAPGSVDNIARLYATYRTASIIMGPEVAFAVAVYEIARIGVDIGAQMAEVEALSNMMGPDRSSPIKCAVCLDGKQYPAGPVVNDAKGSPHCFNCGEEVRV